MPEQRDVTARGFSNVYEPEGYPCCAFCGSEIDAGRSEMLNEAHASFLALALADPESEEFAELREWARSFVGE